VTVTDDPGEFAAALATANASPDDAREWLDDRKRKFNQAVAEAVA
jgi:hypothetical protein